ncbi:hypothetical protein EB118_23240 [bacterium]|nr:hypothetical protein [bacterium]NDG32969.1 hypothetical protein [bacterium]
MHGFEDWLNSIEGFSLRSERAYEDLVLNASGEPTTKWREIKTWLEAAYIAGWNDAKTHIREILK